MKYHNPGNHLTRRHQQHRGGGETEDGGGFAILDGWGETRHHLQAGHWVRGDLLPRKRWKWRARNGQLAFP